MLRHNQVLNGLSLSVSEGEIFGVLGANGSGKTTLMRVMVGLLRSDGGTITIHGESPSPRQAAMVGYMPQVSALYLELSVERLMSTDRVLAITERIIRQILRDRRSIGLLIVGPLIVMSLVGFSLYEQRAVLDRVAPGLLAVFVMFFTFILTGVGFLRERAQGTLERLQTTLVGSFDIMLGYMIGFLIFAIVQTAIGAILFLVVTVAVSLGIFISSFANNEFQVIQFIPIVLAPQIFLSGVIIPVEQMPTLFEWISVVLPLTYAVDALREIMLRGTDLTAPGSTCRTRVLVALLAAARSHTRRVGSRREIAN
ncbi:ABC transporter G family member 20 [Geodia barretti]|uniref:ABC transporter G family member 20 n=1 Tax=Geodia barretti TaxID=519541 RepID=A0AA35WDN5_GEOBA|nr:ABC transporter G family member 20 [Geodia barretti]